MTSKTILFVAISPNVAQNSVMIPAVFHDQGNPWVFQVCGRSANTT